MRVIKDQAVEVQNTSVSQAVPKGIFPNATTSTISFDPFTNLFYGYANNSSAPLGSRVVATMNVGVTPAGLAITPDGKKAYVANNNNYGIVSNVTVLDLTTNMPLKTINDPSFNGPYTVTINSKGTRTYVTNSGGTTITIINTVTDTVIGTIGGFDGPSGMVIKGDTAYVNNYGSGNPLQSGFGTTVRVVDLIGGTIVGPPILVGQAPAAITMAPAIAPDQSFVYTANYIDGNTNTATLSKISTATNSVVATIGPFSPNGFSGPFAIAITPDGAKAYVTNFGSNNFTPFGTTVSVVDLQTNTIVNTINLGIQPSGLAISKDGTRVYVSNYNTLYSNGPSVPPPLTFTGLTAGEGTVNIIDGATGKVLQPTIVVGQSPSAIAISPNGGVAYVSNYTSNTVTAITL
jgi:YVTN family beta-propeller protein